MSWPAVFLFTVSSSSALIKVCTLKTILFLTQVKHFGSFYFYLNQVFWFFFYGVVCWSCSISAAGRKRLDKLIKKASLPSWLSAGSGREQDDGQAVITAGAGVPPPAGDCHSTGQLLQWQIATPQVCEGPSCLLQSHCATSTAPSSIHLYTISKIPIFIIICKLLFLHTKCVHMYIGVCYFYSISYIFNNFVHRWNGYLSHWWKWRHLLATAQALGKTFLTSGDSTHCYYSSRPAKR